MAIIEIKNFTKKYGEFTAVNNLNLSISKGEIVGFVGKNGAGKSTTLRSMLNIILPTAGSIEILGMDSIKNSKAIKEKVSYIPSEAAFYDNITVEQILRFALQFSEATIQEMEELACYFELDLTKKVMELSLGNRKKVSLVQGFLKKAEVIILDEPTGGLDPLMQNKFFDLLLREKERGATIFLSSHNLVEIEKYCDKVAIIKDGLLVDFLDMKNVEIARKQVVDYVTTDGKACSFELASDINTLIADLAKLDLVSLEIKTKTVEDEFIEYYKVGE